MFIEFVQWIYRMFPETFEEVLRIIGPGLRAIDAAGKNPIPIGKQLLIAIWFMATPDSYRYIYIYIYIYTLYNFDIKVNDSKFKKIKCILMIL